MRTFNVRLAAILLAILVVFGIGVYFLHGYQVQRNAYVFKREAERAQARAEEAAKEKDAAAERSAFKESIKNLSWYVRLVPDDVDAVEQLGMLLADQGARQPDVLPSVWSVGTRGAPGSHAKERPPPVGRHGDDGAAFSGRQGPLAAVSAEGRSRGSGIVGSAGAVL